MYDSQPYSRGASQTCLWPSPTNTYSRSQDPSSTRKSDVQAVQTDLRTNNSFQISPTWPDDHQLGENLQCTGFSAPSTIDTQCHRPDPPKTIPHRRCAVSGPSGRPMNHLSSWTRFPLETGETREEQRTEWSAHNQELHSVSKKRKYSGAALESYHAPPKRSRAALKQVERRTRNSDNLAKLNSLLPQSLQLHDEKPTMRVIEQAIVYVQDAQQRIAELESLLGVVSSKNMANRLDSRLELYPASLGDVPSKCQ